MLQVEIGDLAAQAFDLADRLQTTIFLMLDLDIGMNHRLCRPLKWDDGKLYDRGKVMTATMLDDGRDFGRYLDVDGDGIPYRTYPGTHATKGSFFTRGTSRDRYARYTEEGPAYQDNMQRLLRKFETAKDLVPRPLQANAGKPTKYGVIYFGSTAPAMDEAIGLLEARGHELDRLRIRAFPFHSSVASFIADHDFVYVVEQNRDGQMRQLIVNENGIDPVRLVPIRHFDGTPITAASSIAGWLIRTASISAGAIFSPPRMIMSLIRPTIETYPSSSISARSPVCIQPSPSIASAVRSRSSQ